MDRSRRVAWRFSPILPLLLPALAACGSAEPPHSDYAVIQFEKGSAQLTDEGRNAIAHMAGEIKTKRPTTVRLRGDAAGDNADIARARVDAVRDALRTAGVPDAAVETSEAANRLGVATEDVVLQLVFDPHANDAARHDRAVAKRAEPAAASAPSED